MTWLLDGNVLVALMLESHVHHDRAHRWFASLKRNRFATCTITQGTLLRMCLRESAEPDAAAAWEVLARISAHPKHEWWGDMMSFLEVRHRHLQGPAQVTDAWLAELARRRRGRLGTFDSGLAALHADVAELLPRSRRREEAESGGLTKGSASWPRRLHGGACPRAVRRESLSRVRRGRR